MGDTLETVKVIHKASKTEMEINVKDFDKDVYEKFVEKKASPKVVSNAEVDLDAFINGKK